MARAHLYGLAYSPWTERARWALDHHRIAYDYHEHVPMLGEPLLRLRAKVPAGQRTTVPLFVDEHGARFMDSIAIILRSDEGKTRPLVGDAAALRELAAIIEPALHACRARVTSRILADPAALRESATAAVPSFMAGLAAPVAALGAKFIAKKHGAELGHEAENIDALRKVLAVLRPKVQLDQPPTRETLTATDILIATLLQPVRPVDAAHIALGPAVRRAWNDDALAREFADLVAWRDATYRAAR
ncbi:MAG: glutathione S-transferase N-terminal domain-containing protein [Myxococcales bacterium]|nr:glutathione S-transferase N-terminal domain-containing protein [Myxococcales bacterium]